MRRTQIVVIELRPGAEPAHEGQVIVDPEDGPFDVLGWVMEAHEPIEEHA